jgi:aminoglycoside/choline kinase family phosphotransferase
MYRLFNEAGSIIGVYDPDRQQQVAFINFAKHFASFRLPVPTVIATGTDCYLLQDLGTTTLMDLVAALREGKQDSSTNRSSIEELYCKAIDFLPRFQIEAGRSIDFNYCVPRRADDFVWMIEDMHYFRDSFLKLSGVRWNDHKLDQEFTLLAEFLRQAESNFFLYRDFQARNIMVQQNELYFIDFQSGFRGALQYDLATLLYQARAQLTTTLREKLVQRYLGVACQYVDLDAQEFLYYFPGFVLLRRLQTLGAYGKAGLIGGKEYFLSSIPFAVRELKQLLELGIGSVHLPELGEVAAELAKKYGVK